MQPTQNAQGQWVLPDGRVYNAATQQYEMPAAPPSPPAPTPPAPPAASMMPPPPTAAAIGAAPGYGAPPAPPQYAAPAPVHAPAGQPTQDRDAGRCKVDARLSWFYVLRRDDKGKQRVTLLIPKSDTATKALMDQKVIEGLHKKWSKPPQYYSNPIKDGDTYRDGNGKPAGDECKGHWFINAVANDKYGPAQVFDIYGSEITDPRAVKAGDYARVSVTFYGSDKENKIGVFCALNRLVFLREGEALGGTGGISAEQEFAGDFQAPPAGYVPPPRYTPPQAGPGTAPPPPQAPVTAQPGTMAPPPPAPAGYGAPVPPAPPAPAYQPPVVQVQTALQLSPDGRFAWNGTAWIPNDTIHPQHIPY